MVMNKYFRLGGWSLAGMGMIFLGVEAAASSLEGYAAMNGGTTGGEGGEIVHVSSGAGIHEAMCNRAADDTPLIIYVSGTINHDNTAKFSGSCDTTDSSIQFKRVSNISLIGEGDGAVFDEIGIHIRESSNIIIRNIHVRNVKKSGSPISNGGDAIGLEKDVHNIWIDHCELEASGGEKDGYDSLIDMKAGVQYVTVSYNYLHHSGRGGLIGSSDSDNENNYITFHHNWYESVDSRMPLLRYATAHAYNNYYQHISKSAMNPRIGGRIKAENNYFEDVNNPIGTFYTTDMGFWDVSGNIFDNVTWSPSEQEFPAGPDIVSTTTIEIPYSYTLDAAKCVKDIVTSLAGDNRNLAVSAGDCQVDSGDDSDSTVTPSITLSAKLNDNNEVQLNWDITDASVAGLQLYRDVDSNPDGRERLVLLSADSRSYLDTTVSPGLTYYYWVKVSQTELSDFNSEAASVTIPAISDDSGDGHNNDGNDNGDGSSEGNNSDTNVPETGSSDTQTDSVSVKINGSGTFGGLGLGLLLMFAMIRRTGR
ncbi:hypothetical protein [Gynuella sunshinyii]|uniref:Pectate lyase n=1 Tax=Gynuella sunshinyii YC6258 TaxID=1445510 RepID=A0A0C5VIX1_9GAMM|nr:hypothetical protein [Gynuella sunshinyii]AJQ93303.1 pectate lyase [Gynuella sunshinyii YC6258]